MIRLLAVVAGSICIVASSEGLGPTTAIAGNGYEQCGRVTGNAETVMVRQKHYDCKGARKVVHAGLTGVLGIRFPDWTCRVASNTIERTVVVCRSDKSVVRARYV